MNLITMKKDKNKQKKKANSALVQQITAFLLLILVLLSVYIFFKDYSKTKTLVDTPTAFSSEYCDLLRPPGWNGGKEGNSFIFKSTDKDSILILNNVASSNFSFAALNTNHEYLFQMINNFAKEMNIKIEDLKIRNVNQATVAFLMPALIIHIKTKRYNGRVTLFYSHDVRFLYLALWEQETKHNEYIARVFMDYVTLKPSLATPLFKRPIIDSADNIDSALFIKKAKAKIEEATSLWHNAKEAPDNVLHAMKAFQTAMKLLAESGMGSTFDPEHHTIVAIYRKCRQYRKQHINEMKSEILQAKHLGDKDLAKEIAQELMEMASLDDEAETRSWARKQYHEIKQCVIDKE